MDKIADKTFNGKLRLPFIAALIGVLLLVIGIFLPYLTAVGELGEYCAKNPDKIEIEDLGLTASDLKDIPVISVSQLITGVYGEDDGAVANVIVLIFGGFLALTTLFAVLKKPIGIFVFNLFACGTFVFLNFLMKEDFVDPDKYAWGNGYYVIALGFVAVFASAVWLLVKKNIVKKELKA